MDKPRFHVINFQVNFCGSKSACMWPLHMLSQRLGTIGKALGMVCGLHTDMPSSFRWQLSASRLCISFHTWHLSACMWPCIYAFFQTCCVRVSTWLNLGGFTRISCDIMPSA